MLVMSLESNPRPLWYIINISQYIVVCWQFALEIDVFGHGRPAKGSLPRIIYLGFVLCALVTGTVRAAFCLAFARVEKYGKKSQYLLEYFIIHSF